MTATRPDLNEFIETSPWHSHLTPEQLARVLLDTSMRSFDAGSTVCLRGSLSTHWLAVVDGMLKVDTVTDDGRATTFAGVPAGAWFGEGAVLKGEPLPYGVIAIRDSMVAFMPRDTFIWLVDESRGFSRWVIDQLNARLAHYVALVESFRLHDLTSRVAYCVSELFNSQLYPATNRELVISQEEIGRLCGLARPNTNHSLHKLEEAGLLRLSYGVIEVVDLPGLQRYAREK